MAAAEGLLFMIGGEMQSRVTSFLADKISLFWGFKADLKRLEKNLLKVNSLINDASSKTEFQSVQEWLKGLNEIAYEANAVLDEYSYQTLRFKIENRRKRDKVLSIFSLKIISLMVRIRLAHKIRNVNISLNESYAEGTRVNLVQKEAPTTTHSNERFEHPFIDESSIVGRDDDVKKVVNMLCGSGNNGRDNLSVIAITGIGGQGKTTLAKLVYKHRKVLKYFHKLIWITVSNNFDRTRLLTEMTESVTGQHCRFSNIETIVKDKLSPALQKKRYLLVLDDVWNDDGEKWRSFKDALSQINAASGCRNFFGKKSASGSRILTTTRNERVASTMNASFIHRLQQLSDEQSWTIFKQRAFALGGAAETEALVRIGKEIVKKCQGLPLAIKVIGSLMFSKTSENEWQAIQNSELWNLNDDTNRVMKSLKLSYNNLSFPLKRCFSVCSIYPKETEIEKDALIRSWMALGLLQPSLHGGLATEDVGEMYWKTLISCSLLEGVGITLCKIHDIVHDLAVETVKTDYSILNSQASVSPIVDSKLVHLRLLVLKEEMMFKLPDSIKKLKYLRYLDISKTLISELPKSVMKLYNLQAIKINTLELERVDKDFVNLINMRHLYVNCLFIKGYGKDSMSVMKNMSKKLTILNSLEIENCNNGSEFQSIMEAVLVNNNTSLRQLIVKNSGPFTYRLNNLVTLEELHLYSCGEVENIHALPFAKKVVICKSNTTYMHSGTWLQELTSLTNLKLYDFDELESLPDWLGNLSSLQSLELMFCKNLKYLPSVEAMVRLTKLHQLYIEGCPLLKSRCMEDTRPEWNKISHIPNITIDEHPIMWNRKPWNS